LTPAIPANDAVFGKGEEAGRDIGRRIVFDSVSASNSKEKKKGEKQNRK
jgi:hypothetical protein